MIRKYTESETKSYQDLLSQIQQRATIAATAAVIFMITSLVLFVGLLIVANYPKSQGYVIELTPEAEAVYNPDSVTLLEDWQPKDNTINYFLRTFLTELRTVSSDPQIVQQNIQRLYHQVTGNATDKVTDYIEETDPRSRLKRETVTIAIASILPISDTTYQVDFRETVWTNQGKLRSDDHYRAVIHTQIYIPSTHEQVTFNPIGLYVTDFSITLVKEI